MSKSRRCPGCGVSLPVQNGYIFDHELNIRCEKCGKIVFPATPAAEAEFLKNNWKDGHSTKGTKE